MPRPLPRLHALNDPILPRVGCVVDGVPVPVVEADDDVADEVAFVEPEGLEAAFAAGGEGCVVGAVVVGVVVVVVGGRDDGPAAFGVQLEGVFAVEDAVGEVGDSFVHVEER